MQTPQALSDIDETQLLAERGEHTVGQVVGHVERGGRQQCKSFATVAYAVAGRTYQVQIKGCGALPEVMPKGREIDVTFLPERPGVSMAQASNAETSRFSRLSLSGLWALACGLSVATYLVFRRPQA